MASQVRFAPLQIFLPSVLPWALISRPYQIGRKAASLTHLHQYGIRPSRRDGVHHPEDHRVLHWDIPLRLLPDRDLGLPDFDCLSSDAVYPLLRDSIAYLGPPSLS